MPELFSLGLTGLEGDHLHKPTKRIRNERAKDNPFSTHLFSSLRRCWRGNHPSALQLLLNTGSSNCKNIPAPTHIHSSQPSETSFHAQSSVWTLKTLPKSGSGRCKHPLLRPRSCSRKGWLLRKVPTCPASTGFDGLHFIAGWFYSMATGVKPDWTLGFGEIPLLMVPRAQSPALGPWNGSCLWAGLCVHRQLLCQSSALKPQNVSVNIASHLGEQSMLLSEGERGV